MARRQRSFFLDNKTGKLQSKGKVFVEGTSTHNIAQVKGSTTGNPVALNAIGDDTNIDLRLSAKGNGNIEILSTLEILTNKRITDSAGTNVEFGDNIEMNSNKITGLGTPTSNTDAATKGYVDSNVSSANDATITLTAGTGLSGSGNFTTDQSADETITLTIDSTVATLTGSQTLTNKTIDSASNTLTLDLSEGTLTGTTAEFNTALSDDSFATLTNSVTLTNKTLTSPTINAFSGTGNGSITGTLSIVTTTTDDSLLITTTEDSSSAAPVITLKRNSSSVADADYLGQIKFKGENDADQEVVYAKITGKIGDASDGSEDGIIEIAHQKAGSQNINVRMTSTEFKIMNGTDFDVETHDGSSTGLRLANTLVTATAAELNRLDGIGSAAVGLTDTQTLTNKTLTSPQITTDIRLNAQAELEFYDSDSSHYVAFRAPATVASSLTWTLPATDGTANQVLETDGAGTLGWADAGSGGGSGSSFPNSTFQTVPGTAGNFDFGKNVAQTVAETPFEASGTDAFGVNLGSVFSAMDPVGTTDSIDYGDGESFVGE